MEFQRAFEEYVQGKRVLSHGFIPQTSENGYVGGYYIEFDNLYKYLHYGGCFSGSDSNLFWIINSYGDIIACKEEIN